MAKKQSTDPKTATLARIQRTEAYAEQVRLLFARTVNEILALNKTLPTLDEGVMFSFDDTNAKKRQQVETLLRRLRAATTLVIQKGVKAEWAEANAEADRLVASVFGREVLGSPQFAAYTQRNAKAMQAFIARSDHGLNLSDRVWKSVRQLRDEMEVAMTVAIGEGESAADMSRKVRQYLNDPDLMFRRFRYKIGEREIKDADGKVVGKEPVYGRKWKKRVIDPATGRHKWIDYDRDSYPTGRGVYKSSARNAMRVTRTETNIAYRRADHERWGQMDFVIGQRIQLSKNHPATDICDELQGDYPKDFVFDGWHPQCFCFVTPITVPPEETARITEAFLKGEDWRAVRDEIMRGRQITEYPANFKNWVASHADNIAAARVRGTAPYFITNNGKAIDGILGNDTTVQATPAAKTAATAQPVQQQPQNVAQAKPVNEVVQNELLQDIPAYSTTIPKDSNGNVDVSALRTQVIQLMTSHGGFSKAAIQRMQTANVATLQAQFTYTQKAIGIIEYNTLVGKVNALRAKLDFSKLQPAVARQFNAFANQHDNFMQGGDIIRARNALAGYVNLNALIKAKVDFSTTSMLMPVELLPSGKWFGGAQVALSKEFFDMFKEYVPLKIVSTQKANTFYSSNFRSVTINTNDSRYPSLWYRQKTIYHEFGHALDHARDLCHDKRLLDVWGKFAVELQQKEQRSIVVEDGFKLVGKTIVPKRKRETGQMELGYAIDKRLTLLKHEYPAWEDSMFQRLGIERGDFESLLGSFADCVNSLSKGKYAWGHHVGTIGLNSKKKNYWLQNADNPMKELIAHAFENKYVGNTVFEMAYPTLYKELMQALNACLK